MQNLHDMVRPLDISKISNIHGKAANIFELKRIGSLKISAWLCVHKAL